MRTITVLHVGSFRGNIGDNANHLGFRSWWEQLLDGRVVWQEFEIRNVYRGVAEFGASFVGAANRADLVVVGGGNYFELWVESSPTGTSISIKDDVFAEIQSPIFFNALGVDEGQGVTETTLQRFRSFLSRVLGSDQYLVSVRNDGASATLAKYVADLPLDRIVRLPDGGFFANYGAAPGQRTDGIKRRGMKIAINLAGDMLDRRFPGEGFNDYEAFLKEFVDVLHRLDESIHQLNLVFVPHVFGDLRVYADLLTRLPDELRREKVRVAAYDTGSVAAATAFSEYLDADVVFAMRFHANVVPIANSVPTIGLVCYDQIQHLYRELELSKYAVDVRVPRYGKGLIDRFRSVTDTLADVYSDLANVNAAMKAMRKEAERVIVPWLDRRGLGRLCR